jgi:nucleoside-diphosphate-sugar epimerase
MARILIVGGGCRGRLLAADLIGRGHAVRITTRTDAGRPAIEAVGGECWIGTPDRIGSLRYALQSVTVLCWLLGTARGDPTAVGDLHGRRLEFMLSQTIDTTVRGVVYEAGGTVDRSVLAHGAALVEAWAAFNRADARIVATDPADAAAWLAAAVEAVDGLVA